MSCKECKFFKKIRSLPFGECSNDEVFQYAEDKEDLKDIGNNVLVILGEGEPVVGIEYSCSNFVSRKLNKQKTITKTSDFDTDSSNFIPDAKKKRQGIASSGRRRGLQSNSFPFSSKVINTSHYDSSQDDTQ
jgi:hypothetical protein